MAAGYNQLIIRWKDVNGLFATTFMCTQDQDPFDNSDLVAVKDACQGMSNCGVQFIQFQQTIQVGNDPTTGTYGTIYDRALMLDRTDGPLQYGQIQIPGPKSSIFQGDNMTVDMSNPLVTALTDSVVTALALPPGNAITAVYSGRRSRVRTNQA